MHLNTALYAASALVASYVCYQIVQNYQKLKDIPGPFWAKLSDLQRLIWVKSLRSHKIYQKLHEDYGECVRIGPNVVSVSNPAYIQTLYPTRLGFVKNKFYNAFMPYTKQGPLPAIFTTQDDDLHKQLKTPIAQLYNLSSVVQFEPFVDEVLGLLFEQLDKRFVEQKKVCNLGDWIQFFALDVMGEISFSERYGFLETGADVQGIIKSIWNFMLTVGPMSQVPWFDKLWHKSALVNSLKKQNHGSPILRVVTNAVNERRKRIANGEKGTEEGKKDFLDRYLGIQASDPAVQPWWVTAWTLSNVIAGSDSTSAVMRAVMWNVLAHEETHKKLLTEIRSANLSRPYPTWKEIIELPYLDACINEAIRIHPSFCLPLERIVPAGGITISGHFLEEGTVVGMNPYVVNRDRETYGEDADDWRPERWMGISEEQWRKMDGNILTWGAGRRICLGKNIALMEIKKLVPALLLNYEWELTDPTAYSIESCWFLRQQGINVRIKKSSEAL